MKPFIILVIIILFVSCSKSSNNNSNGNTQQDGWTLGSTDYKTVSTYRSTTIYFGTRQSNAINFLGNEVGGDPAVRSLPRNSAGQAFKIKKI